MRRTKPRSRRNWNSSKRYLAIEQVRFSDRLRPQGSTSNAAIGRAAVPRFVLQPSGGERAAPRHRPASRRGHGQVIARREGADLVLTVRDDGPGIGPAGAEPTGVGLANTRARLAALYGARVSRNRQR
jgi:two-component system, LytTR family, sensor kinase